MTSSSISPEVRSYIALRRVARLASADGGGAPHVIPICYAFDGQFLYSALDLKPKRAESLRLKRVRNIIENPHVALVIDDYSEAWDELSYVLIQGEAEILVSRRSTFGVAVGLSAAADAIETYDHD